MKTKDKILIAGANLFAKRGYDGTSVRDIIKEAGVNQAAITYYFGSKYNLFIEIIITKIKPIQEKAKAISEKKISASKKLFLLLEMYAEYLLYQEPTLKALFSELILGGDRLSSEIIEIIEKRNKIFDSIIKEGIESGEFKEIDRDNAPWIFHGMLSSYILFGPAFNVANEDPKIVIKRIVKSSFDIFLNGIKKNDI